MSSKTAPLRGFDDKVMAEFGRLCQKCDAALWPKIAPSARQERPAQEQKYARIVRPHTP